MQNIPAFFKSPVIMVGTGIAAVGLFAVAFAASSDEPARAMVPAKPVPIAQLTTGSDEALATVNGKVVETFGNSFILQDATGRVLIQTGHHGRASSASKVGESITVQGRLENGVLRPSFLVGADGKVTALGHRRGGRRHGHHERPDNNGRQDPAHTGSSGPTSEALEPDAATPSPAQPAVRPTENKS